ncbi:hypothetical protein [Plectonema phage JingP1]|uniref:Uncharacterized protein n=1 Tax=Plectonema phage JingP1 TaxID=2961687 RepID=A0A9E7T4L2_9CAUD|nr:hypothetical protein [Plectonema phage JingP1]
MFSIQPPDKFMTQQLLFSLGGVALTIIGLSFTITRPTLERIDELRGEVIELKATTRASDSTQDALERRLTRIETDLYRMRQEYTQNATK